MTDTRSTTTTEPRPVPLVEMRDIRVAFGGLHAVDGVTIDLLPGEVVALVGGNGAGKSTLMHTLAGAHPADSGQIFVNGEPVTIHQPRDAQKHGIETIQALQELRPALRGPDSGSDPGVGRAVWVSEIRPGSEADAG